jgi:hypothetical protein
MARKEGATAGLLACDLANTAVGDRGVTQLLAENLSLRTLILQATQVTDAGLVGLENLRDLAKLDLSYCGVSDRAMRSLPASLVDLGLRCCRHVSLEGILHAAPKLTRVDLCGVRGAATAWRSFAQTATRLEHASLRASGVGDYFVAEIPAGSVLTTLDLSCCPGVTDAALPTLTERCPRLLKVDLWGCAVSETGLQGLESFLAARRR